MVENAFKVDKVLDLRGWSCPWCLVKARSWLSRMKPGEILEVISTDAEIRKNFPQILEGSQDRVIGVEQKKDFFCLFVRRGCKGNADSQEDSKPQGF